MKANVAAYINFRFEKIRLLKQNSKSEVWLALNKLTNQPVILKIINSGGLPYAALKNLSHPLLAKIFYCAESESDTVIVEEFIAGETLTDRILTETEARRILLQLCDGLKFLHAQGIIHRDIKPSNLILQSNGDIRLIDFDAARTFKAGQSKDTVFIGTKDYAPPEQFGFGQTDARSDIYALGKTFIELTGENCGVNLKKILAKCTEVDAKNRYQNVDELKAALTKKFLPRLKFGVLFAVALTVIFLLTNSTQAPSIPAEIKNVTAEIETPADTENLTPPVENNSAEKISAPVENENLREEIPAVTEKINILDEIKTAPAQIENSPAEVEEPQNVPTMIDNNYRYATPLENLPNENWHYAEIDTPAQNENLRDEIITPAPNYDTEENPPAVTIENFQPSFPDQNTTLENFQPSFPAPSTFLENLPAR